MPNTDNDIWYHGTPLHLDVLKEGSTVTRIEALARVFSTRPGLVSVSDDGCIRHDGKMKGNLYRIDEPVSGEDITPHPASTMEPGWEWVTKRQLKLTFLYEYTAPPEDILTEEEVSWLKKRP